MELSKCSQPYFELQLQYDQQVRCCCYSAAPSDLWDGKSDFELQKFWNGPKLRTVRAVVASNRAQNTGCDHCQFLKYVASPCFLTPPDCLDALQRKNWEKALLHYQRKDLILESTPVKFYLNFGLACNLNCVMCSQQDERKTDHRELSVERLLALKEHMIVANELALIGGEPLVLPSARRFITAITADADYANVQLSLYSNGALLHKFLDRLQAMRRVNIIISLDSIGDAYEYIRRGARWESTSKNILEFKKLGAKSNLLWGVNVSSVVMKSSIPKLPEFVDWCIDHELPVHFVPVSCQHFTQQEDVFHNPSLLKEIPEWAKAFDRAIGSLETKGWVNAGAGPLSIMKAQLIEAVAALPKASGSRPSASKPEPPVQEFAMLSARLGRMLGRSEPLSEAELNSALVGLTQILDSGAPVEFIEENKTKLPAAVGPLLCFHLGLAWAAEDSKLAGILESCQRCFQRRPIEAASAA
jgi:pyruvate-formate lyase-activating enzyme